MEEGWEIVPRESPGVVKRTLGGATANVLETLQVWRPSDEKHASNEAKRKKHYESRGRKYKPWNNAPNAAEGLAKSLGTTREQLAPQGFAENVAQRILSQAPLIAATGGLSGGSVIGNLARTSVGSAVGAGLEESGAPWWLQTAGQLATEVGLGVHSRNKKVAAQTKKEIIPGKKPESGLSVHKGQLYDRSRGSVRPGESAASTNIDKALMSVGNELPLNTDSAVKSKVIHAGESIEGIIDKNSGLFDLAKADEVKKNLNAQIYDRTANTPEGSKKYLRQFANGLSEDFRAHGPANPSFWENLDAANTIHKAQQANEFVADAIKEYSILQKLNPIKQLGGVLKKIGANAAYLGVKPIRTYYGKLIEGAWNESSRDIAKYSALLGKAVDKANVPEQEDVWEIVPRGT